MKNLQEQKPFEFLKDVEPKIFADTLKDVNINVLSLILSAMPPEYVSEVLIRFDDRIKVKISIGIANLKDVNNIVIQKIEVSLKKKFNFIIKDTDDKFEDNQDYQLGGVRHIARVLNSMGSFAQEILMNINALDPSLAYNIKEYMFIFEDLIDLETNDLFKIFQNVKLDDIVYALNDQSKETIDNVTLAMTPRVKRRFIAKYEQTIKVKIKDIESAQKKIVGVAKRLLAYGEIERY